MPDTDGFTLAEAIKPDPVIAGATVVMLTSAGEPDDAHRHRTSTQDAPVCTVLHTSSPDEPHRARRAT
jgi:CheY-like chemotaxis protein